MLTFRYRVIDILLNNDVNINFLNKDGENLLCTATKKSKLELAELFIQYRIDINKAIPIIPETLH